MPSLQMREQFLSFATKRQIFETSEKLVFVVPVFEKKKESRCPNNKIELIDSSKRNETRPFHDATCKVCHLPEAHTQWLDESRYPMKQQELISFNATWDKSWEPFYISSRNVPLFDERFKQYGFDRIEQICELHIAGYKFPVLNNAFLVHDGWKIKHEDDRKTETLQNLILFNFHFQQTLLKMYPNTGRTCAPVKPWIPGPHVRQNVLKKLTKNPNKLKRRHIKNFLRS